MVISLSSMLKFAKTVLVSLGLLIICAAVATWLWDLNLAALYAWLNAAFGSLFLTLYTSLVALCVLAIAKLKQAKKQAKANGVAGHEVWHEVGVQAASGIATLALTFTLLGISLGIESLSQQALSPETIGAVIQELTKHFSMAFMTTVVGLPSAHILRSVLAVQCAALKQATPVS